MEFIKEYWNIILGALSFLLSAIVVVFTYVRNKRRNKTTTETFNSSDIIHEIKSLAYGLITVAEHTFADIPSSGASKLLYVLNQIKALCDERGITFESDYWEFFINGIVEKSNEVQEAKEDEHLKLEIIDKIKAKVPEYVQEANRLFVSIPDSQRYKIAYIVSLIEEEATKYAVDTTDSIDWKAYVTSFYNNTTAGV